jgi:hypothetical protein
MKTSILLLTSIFLLAACKKETKIEPKTNLGSQSVASKPRSTSTPPITKAAADTLPDRAMLKIKLVKDNVNYDETMFIFSHTAVSGYDPNEDSPYFPGYGQESLSSISADGRDLVINTLPYSPGAPIHLNVDTKSDGAFSLQVSFKNKIPDNVDVTIKDNYLKNKVNISSAPYQFSVVKSDTSTYGANRFELSLKAHQK